MVKPSTMKMVNFLYIDFSLQDGELQAAVKDGSVSVPNSIEKILVVGLENAAASVQVSQGSEWNADVIQKTNYAIIKTPGVDLSKDWSIKF